MKHQLITVLAAGLLLSGDAFACVNKAETSRSGVSKSTRARGVYDIEMKGIDADVPEFHEKEVERLRDATDLDGRNDYAVELMYLGRALESIQILLEIENEHPGIYYTASNLGTAYELSGKNSEALRWIREGMVRNPLSHKGTEWLHVKILEAKIKAEKDPRYILEHSITGANYRDLINPMDVATRFDGKPMTVADVDKALEYQLSERVTFVKPPDEVVASLFAEVAQTQAITESLQSTRRILKVAGTYGYPADKLAASQKLFESQLDALTRQQRIEASAQTRLIGFVACSILLILTTFFAYRRGWLDSMLWSIGTLRMRTRPKH